MNINRVAVCRDDETDGLSSDRSTPSMHLRVEDIDNERLIVVGKIKGIVSPGETRKLVNTDAMRFFKALNSPVGGAPQDPDNEDEIVGPALELDILAIYR